VQIFERDYFRLAWYEQLPEALFIILFYAMKL